MSDGGEAQMIVFDGATEAQVLGQAAAMMAHLPPDNHLPPHICGCTGPSLKAQKEGAKRSWGDRFVDWWVRTASAELRFEAKLSDMLRRAACSPSCNIPMYSGTPSPEINSLMHPVVMLYRAVTPEELKQIVSDGKFAASPGGAWRKYFYPTSAQAAQYGERQWGSGKYTVVSGEFPASAVEGPFRLATEGDVFTVPVDNLPLGEPIIP